MKIVPLADRVIVKRVEAEATKGLIFIPEANREKPQLGEVVAVGQGRVGENLVVIPMHVHAGDRIIFGKYAGITVTLDNEEVLIMREDEILGVVAE